MKSLYICSIDVASSYRVAQELYAHGFAVEHSLFYFDSKKQGKLDFVVEYDNRTESERKASTLVFPSRRKVDEVNQVLPIEVKSGKDYDRHNAIANVMGNEDYDIPQAYVFCQENIFTKQNIIYLPIYLITFFKQIKVEDATFKFDLTGLIFLIGQPFMLRVFHLLITLSNNRNQFFL